MVRFYHIKIKNFLGINLKECKQCLIQNTIEGNEGEINGELHPIEVVRFNFGKGSALPPLIYRFQQSQ